MKNFIYFMFLGFIGACSGLENRASQLEIGSSKAEVLTIMGSPPYQYTQNGVEAWRYAVVAGFGYCDYREFYIYGEQVIHINQYHHASIAGCTVGLQKIDWEPILAKADALNREHPQESKQNNQSESRSIVLELKELKELRDSGALSDSEYIRAKEGILNKQ